MAAGKVRAGSIEQHLDMAESGPLRGDEILHHHGIDRSRRLRPVMNRDMMEENYNTDLSDELREGDEDSGDEHSSGFQGSDLQVDSEALNNSELKDPDDDEGDEGEVNEEDETKE